MCESHKESLVLSGKDVTIEAHQQSTYPEFKASPGWLSRLRPDILSPRDRVHLLKSRNYQKTKLTKYHSFVIKHRKLHNYSAADIYNMDETPLRFDMPVPGHYTTKKTRQYTSKLPNQRED